MLRVNRDGYLEEGDPEAPQAPPEVLSTDPQAGMASPEKSGGLGATLSEFWNTTPFNPKNIAALASIKPADIGHMVENSYNSGKEALTHFAQAAGPNFGGLGLPADPQGQLAALEKGITSTVGAAPMVGPPLLNIANQWADGEYAKGAGGVLGLASNALIPDAVSGVKGNWRAGAGVAGRGAGAVGRGMEAAGEGLKQPTLYTAPAMLLNHPSVAALELAIPPALKYGGRGMQALGRSLEGLDAGGSAGATVDQGAAQFSSAARAAQQGAGTATGAQAAAADVPPSAPVTAATVARDYSNLPESLQSLESPVQHGADMYTSDAAQGRAAAAPATPTPAPAPGPVDVRQPMGDPSAPLSPLDAAARHSVSDIAAANAPAPTTPNDMPASLRALFEDSSAVKPMPDDIHSLTDAGGNWTRDPMMDKPMGDGLEITQPAAAPAGPPEGTRELPRRDDVWGANAKDFTGQPAQAAASNNRLLMDPTISTEDLRTQLRNSTDPVEQAQIVKAIRQRGYIDGTRPRSTSPRPSRAKVKPAA